MIEAKFSGGPMNGQRRALQRYEDRVMVREAKPISHADYMRAGGEPYSDMQLSFREGDYSRSNKVQKNGTIVYKWMGWIGE